MKKCFFAIAVFAFLLGGAGFLMAAPFQNGSFEEGPLDIGEFVTLNGVNTEITGWIVESGSIDLIGTYWEASDGERSIDLSGNGPGTISQTFDTVPGTWYMVRFDMAGNPDDAPDVKVLIASVGTSETDISEYEYVFNTTLDSSPSNMGWTTMSFTFVAGSESTKISFTSDNDSAYGPAIDNVIVIEIPRPFPDDVLAPAGAIHAYDNMLWPPNNQLVPVKLEGYVIDELSIARDGFGIGVSKAYLVVDGNIIVLREGSIDLLDEQGKFSVTTYLSATKGAKYVVELYAADTANEPNEGLVDSTFITVPHDMSGNKSGKEEKVKEKNTNSKSAKDKQK